MYLVKPKFHIKIYQPQHYLSISDFQNFILSDVSLTRELEPIFFKELNVISTRKCGIDLYKRLISPNKYFFIHNRYESNKNENS